MRIAVDAMGGDNAPKVIVEGALLSIKDSGTEVILVGDEREIRKYLPQELPKGLKIKHASETIEMSSSVNAIRTKKDNSIAVAASLVDSYCADAMVSMGNTAAALAIATLQFGRIPGIDRPAIAILIPGPQGPTVLLDAGAVVDCSIENILQFAVMGRAYAEIFLERPNPKIGLLSVGQEKDKGNKLIRECHPKLSAYLSNFIGNVEGGDLFTGKADVIVTDGFSGNIALKASEGLAEYIIQILKDDLAKHLSSRLGLLLMRPTLKRLKKKLDYSEYGGAPLLGVNQVCVIGHGRSNAKAVNNAIRVAKDVVKLKIIKTIENAHLVFSVV